MNNTNIYRSIKGSSHVHLSDVSKSINMYVSNVK